MVAEDTADQTASKRSSLKRRCDGYLIGFRAFGRCFDWLLSTLPLSLSFPLPVVGHIDDCAPIALQQHLSLKRKKLLNEEKLLDKAIAIAIKC